MACYLRVTPSMDMDVIEVNENQTNFFRIGLLDGILEITVPLKRILLQ